MIGHEGCQLVILVLIHVMILIGFVVIVKLFSQVFFDLGFAHGLQMPRVEHGHLPVMMSPDRIAIDFDDAVDFGSDGPELAFLWCLVFHD